MGYTKNYKNKMYLMHLSNNRVIDCSLCHHHLCFQRNLRQKRIVWIRTRRYHIKIWLLFEVWISVWDSGLSKIPCGEGELDLRGGDRSQHAGHWTTRGGILTWLSKKTGDVLPAFQEFSASWVQLQALVLISDSPSPNIRLCTAQFLEFCSRLGWCF